MSNVYLCKHCTCEIDLLTCFDFDGLCASCFDADMVRYSPTEPDAMEESHREYEADDSNFGGAK